MRLQKKGVVPCVREGKGGRGETKRKNWIDVQNPGEKIKKIVINTFITSKKRGGEREGKKKLD
ncbi:MAG: hypothetical protein Pars93KO_27490 [Parasphingorhabdus sp.]